MTDTTTTEAIKVVSRDLLRIADLDSGGLTDLLEPRASDEGRPNRMARLAPREIIACHFAKRSTDTRVSFEGAAFRWGCCP